MRIQVRVTPRARRPGVEKRPDGSYAVKVTAAPTEGKANAAVIEALAAYFGVRRGAVRILSGFSGRTKQLEIEA